MRGKGQLSIHVENKKAFSAVFCCFIKKKTNRFHVAVRLFIYRSQKTSKCGKNIIDTLGSCHILTSSVIIIIIIIIIIITLLVHPIKKGIAIPITIK